MSEALRFLAFELSIQVVEWKEFARVSIEIRLNVEILQTEFARVMAHQG